jgi:hypothetical protein
MTRAYHPRISTVQLADDLRRLPNVAAVRIIAPTGGTHPRPARLRIVGTDGTVRVNSLAEARTELAYARAIAYAAATGAQDGRSAAGWYAQDTYGGRVTRGAREAATAVLRGIADGDPAMLDGLPAPDLSGQWADTLTGPALVADALAAAGIPDADVMARASAAPMPFVDWFSDVCDAYESAFSDAVTAEIERTAALAAAEESPE